VSEVQTGTVTTKVPARLDRAEQPRRHQQQRPGQDVGARAIGTGAGGIAGPLLFSHLVGTGQVSDTVVAFSIGATLMILAGVTEIFFGVRAERQSLESIARPLTADDADSSGSGGGAGRGMAAPAAT
jgi:hypothetical protein